MKIKEFLEDKVVKRAGWNLINSLMAFVVAGLTYMATDQNVAWAATAWPIAQMFSQMLTKYVNQKL